MSRKSFLLLVAITVAAVALALMLGQGGRQERMGEQKFLPELAEKVNDINELVHRNADGVVATLSRGEADWTVEELGGYPADWQKVRSILSALAEAGILELKTSNPEYFDRLGVEDPDNAESTSTGLIVTAPDQSWSVIAGDVPGLQFGQYARISGENQALLVDQELNLPGETIDWADRQIIDIGAGLVAGVEIHHADGETVKLSKVSADDSDFSLASLPQGRELQSTYTLNSAAGMFAMLELDDVRRDRLDAVSTAAESQVTLFSGVRVTAQVIEPGSAQNEQAGDESDAGPWLRFKAELVDPASAEAETQQMVEDIQQRTGGWLYRISSTRMDTLMRRNEHFLKPLDDQ